MNVIKTAIDGVLIIEPTSSKMLEADGGISIIDNSLGIRLATPYRENYFVRKGYQTCSIKGF